MDIASIARCGECASMWLRSRPNRPFSCSSVAAEGAAAGGGGQAAGRPQPLRKLRPSADGLLCPLSSSMLLRPPSSSRASLDMLRGGGQAT